MYSWTVSREAAPVAAVPAPAKRSTRLGAGDLGRVDRASPRGGANFVDLTLEVAVVAAKGTMTAHRPQFLHATTRAEGYTNRGTSMGVHSAVAAAAAAESERDEIRIERGEDVDHGEVL